eukprot:gene12143-14349_t
MSLPYVTHRPSRDSTGSWEEAFGETAGCDMEAQLPAYTTNLCITNLTSGAAVAQAGYVAATTAGGGLALETGTAVTMNYVDIRSNHADRGGGIFFGASASLITIDLERISRRSIARADVVGTRWGTDGQVATSAIAFTIEQPVGTAVSLVVAPRDEPVQPSLVFRAYDYYGSLIVTPGSYQALSSSISDNEVGADGHIGGGGLFIDHSFGDIMAVAFTGNKAVGGEGGGIHAGWYATLVMNGVDVNEGTAGGSGGGYGGGLFVRDGASIQMYSSNVNGNTVGASRLRASDSYRLSDEVRGSAADEVRQFHSEGMQDDIERRPPSSGRMPALDMASAVDTPPGLVEVPSPMLPPPHVKPPDAAEASATPQLQEEASATPFAEETPAPEEDLVVEDVELEGLSRAEDQGPVPARSTAEVRATNILSSLKSLRLPRCLYRTLRAQVVAGAAAGGAPATFRK